MIKRIISVILSLLLVIGLCVITPIPTQAATTYAKDMADGTWTGTNGHRYITFGSFESHPLVWRVLDVYTSDGSSDPNTGKKTALLLAEDVLRTTNDEKYEGYFNYTSGNYGDGNWVNSHIRSVLNSSVSGQFLYSFTTQEKAAVLISQFKLGGNSDYTHNGGYSYATTDSEQAFLLSGDEAYDSKYFNDEADRACANTTWWLRSPGVLNTDVMYVDQDGSVNGQGRRADTCCSVRPAIRVDLTAPIFETIPVTFADSSTTTINVTITVNDGTNPVAGAEVLMNSQTKTTGQDGKVQFSLPGGTYAVGVTAQGYSPASSSITVNTANQSETISLNRIQSPNIGKPNDGIHFENPYAYSGFTAYQSVYYGNLTQNNVSSETEGEYDGPILWRILETGNDELFLLSRYYQADRKFEGSGSSNVFGNSGIYAWLGAEYPKNFINGELDVISRQQVTDVGGNAKEDEQPSENGDKFFLLSSTEAYNSSFFPNGDTDRKAASLLDPDHSPAWWLRSPGNDFTKAAFISQNGLVSNSGNFVDSVTGICPAFKLKVSSIIFAYEIGGTDFDGMTAVPGAYEAGAGNAKNFKLTIVNDNIGTLSGVPATLQRSSTGSLTLNGLSPSQTGGDYTINYKIVGNDGAGRAVAGYGSTAATTGASLTLDTSGLVDDSYDAYVWLQKNNAYNSNEGTTPVHFNLIKDNVNAAPPTITSVGVASFETGAVGTFQVTANGSAPITFSLGGAPSGVSIDSNGLMTVDNTVEEGSYPFTITAANGVQPDYVQNFTLTITPVLPNYTITASAGTGGFITPSGTVSVKSGDSKVFTIIPNNYYIISGLEVDGVSLPAANKYTFTNITANHTIRASFTSVAPSWGVSSGGGGYTPPPSATVVGSVIKPIPSTAASGNTTVAITANNITSAINNANASGSNGIVTIDFTTLSSSKLCETTVAKDGWTALTSSSVKTFTIRDGNTAMTFDSKAIQSISTQAAGDVKISAGIIPESMLTEEQKKAADGSPVFDFTIISGNKRITDFSGGKVRISVPYTLKDGENPNAVVVYYLDKNGELQKIMNGVYDRNTGTVTFSTTHFSLYMIGYNLVTFTDVPDNYWGKDYIEQAASRGLVSGVGNKLFQPDRSITRAEFVQMVANVLELPSAKADTEGYSDVTGKMWFYTAVMKAKAVGLLDRFSGSSFNPSQPITREEMAAILASVLKQKGIVKGTNTTNLGETYADAAKIGDMFKDDIMAVTAAKLMQGAGGSRFDPSAATTRAQAATVLMRLLEILSTVD